MLMHRRITTLMLGLAAAGVAALAPSALMATPMVEGG